MDLKQLFSKYDINLSEKKTKLFEMYYQMLVEGNNRFNLTSITEKQDVYIKHFLDSVLPHEKIKFGAKVLDVGGGAGFPSVPLKIVRPDLDITVVDSVNKKVGFVNDVVEKLGIGGIKAVHGRCEDLAKNTTYRENFDCVVARAVAPLSTLLEYTVPFCKVNCKLVLYKGVNYKEELDNSANTIRLLGCKLDEVLCKRIEEGEYDRYYLVFGKTCSTDKKYPRGQNKPRISPLN